MVVKIKHVTLAVKALESMKQFTQMQMESKMKKQKAFEFYSHTLSLKALKALCIVRSRESLVR